MSKKQNKVDWDKALKSWKKFCREKFMEAGGNDGRYRTKKVKDKKKEQSKKWARKKNGT